MAAPVKVEASTEKLEMLARLRAQKAALDAERMTGLNVFELINYEPACIPRVNRRKQIAARLGILDWRDRQVEETGELPPLCGKCPQELFHAAKESDVLFGGAAGGGKSVALVAEALKWCSRYPGLRALIIRRSYGELAESIIPALRKFSFGAAMGCRWNGAKYELRWPTGSLLTLRYLETLDDASRRQGSEIQWLGADEATLLVPGVLDFIRYERLRSGGGLPVVGVRVTANPGGPSHSEIKERYVESTDDGRHVVTDEHGMTIRFIKSLPQQNPHLDPGYLKRLDAIPDPARRAAMRDGDWSVFSGMVFPDFSYDRHVLEPMPLPAAWDRFCSVDWGYTKPWGVLHAAVDPDDRVWMYREIYATQIGETDQARMILEAEQPGEVIRCRWADDAMWQVRGDAKPIAEVYGDNGVWLTPAGKGPGSRIQGWQRWHSYLAEAPACPHHRAMGWETCPKVHIFSTLKNLISEIRGLPYATTGNVEDADTRAPDHLADCGRYLLMNLGGGAEWFTTQAPAATGLPGAPKPLAPLGPWAVREDKTAVVRRRDLDAPAAGAVQLSPFA